MENQEIHIGIVGAGRIGTAIYSLLVGGGSDYKISVADVDSHHKHWAINESHFFDIETPISYGTQFYEFVEGKTLVINALPYTENINLYQACLEYNVPYFDLSEDDGLDKWINNRNYITPTRTGLPFTMPHCGLAPGLSTVVANHLTKDFSDLHDVKIRVGALSQDATNKLKYHASWSGDGFYYNAFPIPEEGKELSQANQSSKVYYHKLGTVQDEDILIFSDIDNPKISPYSSTTSDGRFLMIYRTKGTYGNSLMVKDLDQPDSRFITVINDYKSETSVVDHINGKLLAITDRNAGKKKVVLIDLNNPKESEWKTLIPENINVLTSVNMIDNKLVAHYMIDIISEWVVFDLNGKIVNKVNLPSPGISYGFGGENDQSISWYRFESLVHPPTIYVYDFTKNTSKIYYESKAKFEKEKYVMKQKFYTSKDGTRIPIFIAHNKELVLDGMRPTLLYGYGGFNISRRPFFNKTISVILENDGVYAIANIRGGGEYGQEWHEAGMLDKKQNVFDDFIYAGQFLITEGYTSPERLAIRGGSNGGTLIGAVINQKPNLFRVAFPEVGVMDMLRYEKFTIGWAWAVEFGTVNNRKDFDNLLSYSPLHNIKKQTYPSVLTYTADHDDRVVPAHSFKYAAKLQQHQVSDDPILIRIGTSTGHGAGRSTKKRIKEYAEKWAFMFYEMGLEL